MRILLNSEPMQRHSASVFCVTEPSANIGAPLTGRSCRGGDTENVAFDAGGRSGIIGDVAMPRTRKCRQCSLFAPVNGAASLTEVGVICLRTHGQFEGVSHETPEASDGRKQAKNPACLIGGLILYYQYLKGRPID